LPKQRVRHGLEDTTVTTDPVLSDGLLMTGLVTDCRDTDPNYGQNHAVEP
jgi:hypothetical protein